MHAALLKLGYESGMQDQSCEKVSDAYESIYIYIYIYIYIHCLLESKLACARRFRVQVTQRWHPEVVASLDDPADGVACRHTAEKPVCL